MVWVPENENNGDVSSGVFKSGPNKKRIERDIDKFHKLLNIVLKIAINRAYNEDYSINDEYGEKVAGSNIVSHLNNALSPGKILIGEENFIRILYESDIDPKWIVNENIREKLINFKRKSILRKNPEKKITEITVSEEEPSSNSQPSTNEPNNRKRKMNEHEYSDDDEIDIKRRKQMPSLKPYWEVPPPSSDGDDEL